MSAAVLLQLTDEWARELVCAGREDEPELHLHARRPDRRPSQGMVDATPQRRDLEVAVEAVGGSGVRRT